MMKDTLSLWFYLRDPNYSGSEIFFQVQVNLIVLCIFKSPLIAGSKATSTYFRRETVRYLTRLLVCYSVVGCREFQGDDIHHKRGTVLRAHGKLDFSIHSFTAACLDFSSDDGQM